jgi:hypothetical protein
MMVVLDRILMSTEWEAKYPLCYAWSKTKVGYDHWPILLDTGEKSSKKLKEFFFEKIVALEQGFEELVT